MGIEGVRIGLKVGQFLDKFEKACAEEWLQAKDINKNKTEPNAEHWYKKPIGIIGIGIISGLLVYLASFLASKYLEIHP